MHGTVEASKLRKGKSVYSPWTHISHKELIYLLQKFISPRSKVLLRMPLGGSLVQRRAIQTVFNPFPRWHLEPSPSECVR